jgi:hypothetical protein
VDADRGKAENREQQELVEIEKREAVEVEKETAMDIPDVGTPSSLA